MKCPFRTKKETRNIYNDNPLSSCYGQIQNQIEHEEFEECVENECPYYGKHVGKVIDGSFKMEFVACCRKVENNG